MHLIVNVNIQELTISIVVSDKQKEFITEFLLIVKITANGSRLKINV